jgi:TPM domain
VSKLKQKFFSLFLVLFLLIGLCLPAFASGSPNTKPNIPLLENGIFFVDTTGKIPVSILNQANQKASELNAKGYQIGGWFFNDTPGKLEPITTEFGNYNGIGFGGHDNGVAISVAIDRIGLNGKKPAIFIATGEGIGGLLNDAKVGRIRREVFDVTKTNNPADWQQGFLNTMDAVTGELNGENKYEDAIGIWWNSLLLAIQILIIIVIILVLLYFSSNSSNSSNGGDSDSTNSSWPSGGGGSFSGGGNGDD